jgi:hypothetical protein
VLEQQLAVGEVPTEEESHSSDDAHKLLVAPRNVLMLAAFHARQVFATMPPRPRPAAPRAPAAAAASSNDSSQPAPAPAAAPASESDPVVMPRMNISTLKKFQLLFIAISHNEVRQRGTIPVADQQRYLLAAYQRNVRLWYRDDATLMQMENMPACPLSIKAVGSEDAVVRCMLATTNTGRNQFTGQSMLAKFSETKTAMLSLIAGWNMSCDSPALAATIAGTHC